MSKQRHQPQDFRKARKGRHQPLPSRLRTSEGKPVEECTEECFLGRWRILEMDEWDKKYLDEDGPAHLTFSEDGLGELHFLLINAQVDWSYDAEIGRVDFSFEGFEEMDEISGRGWAKVAGRGKQMVGEIAIHLGDESGFKAKKSR